jgi:hypothetical protein
VPISDSVLVFERTVAPLGLRVMDRMRLPFR